MFRKTLCVLSLVVAALPPAGSSGAAAEMSVEDAWTALPKYQYGQDQAALLAIDRAVIQAMASPAARAACAARLAALLESPDTTLAAKQYACLQLRQVGTPEESPVLARLLQETETSQMACQALEAIPGEASLAALRDGLSTLEGDLLIGVINSVAARSDARSVEALERLSEFEDQQVASAALWALGNLGGGEAAAFLVGRAEKEAIPTPQNLAVPLLRCADALADAD